MKEIGTKGKLAAVLIVLVCLISVTEAVYREYKLEKELDALKIEVETVAPIKTTDGFKTEKKSVNKPVLISQEPKVPEFGFKEEAEIKEIAPVQFKAHEEISLPEEYQEHIETECERLEVDAAYIYALIESESSFRTGLLVSDGGGQSAGLCQINSVNWPDMEKKGLDPLNEFDNITYCIMLVRSLQDRYPTTDHVTTCYKAGEGGAKRLDYHLSVCETINERTEYFKGILEANNGED